MRLRKAIAWTMLGNIVVAASQWGNVVVLAKFSTNTNIGYYAFAQAIVYPLSAFFNLQLRRLQVTDQKGEVSFSSYFLFAKWSGLIALFFACSFGIFAEKNVVDFLPIVVLIASIKVIEGLSGVCYGTLQLNNNMRAVAISVMLRSIVSIISFTLMIYQGYPLWMACSAVLIVWIFVFCIYDKNIVKQYLTQKHDIRTKQKEIRTIIRLGLPLGLIILLNQLHLSLPRYVLKIFTSIEDVGVYAAIASLVAIGSVFMNSVGQAVLPQMAKSFSQRNLKEFLFLFLCLLGFALFVGTGAITLSILAGKEILIFLYSNKFSSQSGLFSWIMMAGSAWYISGAFGQALTAMRKFTSQAWLTGIVVVITLSVSWLTVPWNGTVGAAQGLMVGAIIKLLVQSGQLIFYVRPSRS